MRPTSILILFVTLSLQYNVAGKDSAEVFYERLEKQVSSFELKTSAFSKALAAGDVLERAERIIRDFPDSSASSNLISGDLKLGPSTLSNFRTKVFPELVVKAGGGEDPLIDACMIVDPERNLGYYAPLQCAHLFLWRGETNSVRAILELGKQQIREYYIEQVQYATSADDGLDRPFDRRVSYEDRKKYLRWLAGRDRLIDLYKSIGDIDSARSIYEDCYTDHLKRRPYPYIYLDQKETARLVLRNLEEEDFFREQVEDLHAVSVLLDVVNDYLEVGVTNKAIELLDYASDQQSKTSEPYQEAASKYQEHGAISQIAFLYCEMLATNKAIQILDVGMEQIPEIAAPDVKVYQLISIADAYFTANRSDKGLGALDDARVHLEKCKDIHTTLAVAKKYAELQGAEMTHQLLSTLYTDLVQRRTDPSWIVRKLVDMASVYVLADMQSEAMSILNHAYDMSAGIVSSSERCKSLIKIADVYIHANDLQKVSEVLGTALVTSQSITKPDVRALKLVGIAELHIGMGNLKKAEGILNDAYLIIKSELDPRKKRDVLLRISKGLIELTSGSQLDEDIPSINLRL